MSTHKVFISYSHKDQLSVNLANSIQALLKKIGIKVFRDITDLYIKDDIPLFMAHIDESDKTIAILDDNYFHSEPCMQELINVYQKDNSFVYLFPIIISNKREWFFKNTYNSIAELKKYWKEQTSIIESVGINDEERKQLIEFYSEAAKVGELLLKYIKNHISMLDNNITDDDYRDFLQGLGISNPERIIEAISVTKGEDLEEIEVALDRYREFNPKFCPSLLIFSDFYAKHGLYKWSNRMLEQIPDDYARFTSEKNFYTGLNLLKLKKPIDEAMHYLIKGLEISSSSHSNNSILYGLLADRMIDEGKLDEAIVFLDMQYEVLYKHFLANRRCPTAPKVKKGYLLIIQGKVDKAFECFENIVELSFTGSMWDVLEQDQNKYYAFWGLSYLEKQTEKSNTFADNAKKYFNSFIDEQTGKKKSPNLGNYLQELALKLEMFDLLNESINCWMIIKHIDYLTIGKESNEYLSVLTNLIILSINSNNTELATTLLKEGEQIIKTFKADQFLHFQFINLLKEYNKQK